MFAEGSLSPLISNTRRKLDHRNSWPGIRGLSQSGLEPLTEACKKVSFGNREIVGSHLRCYGARDLLLLISLRWRDSSLREASLSPFVKTTEAWVGVRSLTQASLVFQPSATIALFATPIRFSDWTLETGFPIEFGQLMLQSKPG